MELAGERVGNNNVIGTLAWTAGRRMRLGAGSDIFLNT